MYRKKVLTVWIARVEQVQALRRSEIAFLLFVAVRPDSERDIEAAKGLSINQQVQFAVGLVDDHLVGKRKLTGLQPSLAKAENGNKPCDPI
jgi:hypothetical protein